MLKKKSSLRHTGAFWAFVAPCCILFGIFFLLPLVLSIAFSFTNYDGWKVMDFVGIKNYITLFKDSKFYASMGRTMVYTLCCLPFRVIIPPLISQFLNLIKNSSLVMTIGVMDLTYMARQIEAHTFHGFEAFTVSTAMYLCISLLVSLGVNLYNRRVLRVRSH